MDSVSVHTEAPGLGIEGGGSKPYGFQNELVFSLHGSLNDDVFQRTPFIVIRLRIEFQRILGISESDEENRLLFLDRKSVV
jgi:hypothetical protein